MWTDLLVAFGLLLVLEGIMPFINPASYKDKLRLILEVPDSTLRYLALGAMLAGVALVNIVR